MKPTEPKETTTPPAGVMGRDYAQGRIDKAHLRYRYKVRGQVAVDAYRSFHPSTREVSVLDLGAAEGRTLAHIHDLFGGVGRFVGIEYAPELIEAAPPLPEKVQLVQGDVIQLPEFIEKSSFDLCAALAVLEHLARPLDCLREAFRVLRPGGVFVATSPHPFWDWVAGRLGLVQDEHHETEITQRSLDELAGQAGFVKVQTRPFMWVVTGSLPYFGWSPDPARSLFIDSLLDRLPFAHYSFVNQALIAQKPF